MIQITIIKIDNYGPWTLTLGHDREHKLQIFQSMLYKEMQELFSKKNSLVFSNRYDELFAITNKLTLKDHIQIQRKSKKLFINNLSMFIGYNQTPLDANIKAFEGEKLKTILNKKYNIYGFVNKENNQNVTIMHFDIEDFTSKKITQTSYETSSMIFELYYIMSNFFLSKKSLSFFMGGDNFMVLAGNNYRNNAMDFINMIKKQYGLVLNCGIGSSATARDAAKLATESLDTIRKIRKSHKKKQLIYEI